MKKLFPTVASILWMTSELLFMFKHEPFFSKLLNNELLPSFIGAVILLGIALATFFIFDALLNPNEVNEKTYIYTNHGKVEVY